MRTKIRTHDDTNVPPHLRNRVGWIAEPRPRGYYLIDFEGGGQGVMHESEFSREDGSKPDPDTAVVMVGYCPVTVPASTVGKCDADQAMWVCFKRGTDVPANMIADRAGIASITFGMDVAVSHGEPVYRLRPLHEYGPGDALIRGDGAVGRFPSFTKTLVVSGAPVGAHCNMQADIIAIGAHPPLLPMQHDTEGGAAD